MKRQGCITWRLVGRRQQAHEEVFIDCTRYEVAHVAPFGNHTINGINFCLVKTALHFYSHC
jgi:hypothetical protein